LAVATFVAPLTGLLGPTRKSDRWVIAGAAIVLFSLVLLRMVGVVKSEESAAARERAPASDCRSRRRSRKPTAG
jgi:hypothetical protein